MCHRIEIRSTPNRISIEFHEIIRDHVQATISVGNPDPIFSTDRCFYGMDVKGFVDGMERLHRELSGSARLWDWDGETLLCFTVLDDVEHGIAIGGRLWLDQNGRGMCSEDNFLEPYTPPSTGLIVAFEGLEIDQSHLPEIIGQTRRFLNETGISTKSVFE